MTSITGITYPVSRIRYRYRMVKLFIVAGIVSVVVFIIWYTKKKSRNNYTTPGGQWVLKWDTPTGTPPFTYEYTISDETGNQIVSSDTIYNSLILDPTLFIPDQTPYSLMSDKTYSAKITASNSMGSGGADSFNFKLYDTPSIVILQNNDTNMFIYRGSGGGASIFSIGTGYNQLASSMALSLQDAVTLSNLKLTVQSNGKTYYPIQTLATNANSNGEASMWNIVWGTCSSSGCTPQTSFSTGDQVVFTVSATNPAGTFSWSNTYTVPNPPPTPPSRVQAQLEFDNTS